MMENDDDLQKALTRSLKLLSFRPRTEKEIEEYLIKKQFSQNIIDQTIERLIELKFLDDKEFTRWWIEQRQNFKPKGKLILKQELMQKGVDRTLAEEELENKQDDYKIAKELFEKKKHRFEKYKGEEYKKKVYDYFTRRGFSFDTITKIWK